MRIVTSALLVAGLGAGSVLFAAPGAVAATSSVTICAKAPGKFAPVFIDVGFFHEEGDESTTYSVAKNKCVTIAEAPAPSGAWAEANRKAKRIVVKTPSGKTNVKNTDRVDFSLGSGDSVMVIFYFAPK